MAAALGLLTAGLALAPPASAAVQDHPVPTSDAGLHSIATGKDGSLWFTEEKKGKVGRITTSGQITERDVPWDGTYGPEELTVANDGRIWVLSDAHARVFVVDPAVGVPTVPKGILRTAKGRVPVRVACPKGAADRCRGTVRPRTARKVRLGGRGKASYRTVSAAGGYTVAPGKTGTIRVKLSSTGRKVVRKGRRTKVVVEVTPTGAKTVGADRTVSLRG